MKEEKLTYEQATAEIEAILKRFRQNEVSIDELAAEVKRATELITLCRDRLRTAEEELNKIFE